MTKRFISVFIYLLKYTVAQHKLCQDNESNGILTGASHTLREIGLMKIGL